MIRLGTFDNIRVWRDIYSGCSKGSKDDHVFTTSVNRETGYIELECGSCGVSYHITPTRHIEDLVIKHLETYG